eukprot:gene478-10155_t
MPSAPRHKPVVQSSAVYHICSFREDCFAVNRTRIAKSRFCPNVIVRWKKMLKETSLKRFKDCKTLYDWGNRRSGIYEIWPKGTDNGNLAVFCNMDVDGGGWITIQRRVDENRYFNSEWKQYKDGFGDLSRNMWIGLENMNFLTSSEKSATLRVDITFQESARKYKAFAKYETFKVQSEANGYRLHIGNFSGNDVNAMETQNGKQFSTGDRDQDGCSCSCASLYTGGWWFGDCSKGPSANLNGIYTEEGTDPAQEITWKNEGKRKIVYVEMSMKYN